MSVNANNIRAYGDVTQRIFTGPFGSAVPTSPLVSAVPAGYFDVGFLDDASGLVEGHDLTTTPKYVWQGSGLARTLKSQEGRRFTFNSVEENATTMGLLYPAAAPVSTGYTAEVQTITIGGTASGGTFTIYSIWGTYVAAFNVTTAALATALSALFGFTVAVSGTVSVSYALTFPANLGNVPQMQVTSQLTGTSPTVAIATTTPGVTGINTQDVKPYTGLNVRAFLIYLIDGGVHHCKYVANGEAVGTGDITYQGSDWTMWQYTINCYLDITGRFFQDINDNAAAASGFYS